MFLRAGGGINLAGFGTPTGPGTRDILVSRYTPSGKSDQNTGNGGFVTTAIDSADSVASGLLPSANDGYVIGGTGKGGAVFVQYQKYGALDLSFGVNGVSTVGPEGTAALWLASQSSGNIVAAVASSTFRVVRLTPVGKLDPSFGTGGVADVGDGGSSAAVVLVSQQPKDALVVVGTRAGVNGSRDVALVRLTEAGQVDTSYGSSGWAFAHFGPDGSKSSVSAAVLQGDGAVVIAGQTSTDSGQASSVIRFSSTGALDAAFRSARSPDLRSQRIGPGNRSRLPRAHPRRRCDRLEHR